MENLKPTIVLASQSPRRKELLEKNGVQFQVFVTDADETVSENMSPNELVKELSFRKAKSAAEHFGEEQMIVIGADTVVALNGEIFGKPTDERDAFRMLSLLQGNTHSVYTGYTLAFLDEKGVRYVSDACETKVRFRSMSDEEIREYIGTNEPFDKAGSYAIQGIGSKFVEKISGSFDNVVGLPVDEILRTIEQESH